MTFLLHPVGSILPQKAGLNTSGLGDFAQDGCEQALQAFLSPHLLSTLPLPFAVLEILSLGNVQNQICISFETHEISF